MKIFYLTDGSGIAIAHKLQLEGHDTFIYNTGNHNLLHNVVDTVEFLHQGLARKPDLIVIDHPGQGRTIEKLRQQYPVIGSSVLTDTLCLDTDFGVDTMQSLEIRTLKGRVKPQDNLFPHLLETSIRGSNISSFVEGGVNKSSRGQFSIEEFIYGLPITTEMWFSHGKPIYPAFGILESNKFLSGDWGPNAGTQVSLLWPYDVKEPRIFQSTLKKILPIIERTKYTGPLSITSIICERDGKPYSISWHAGFRYNSIYGFANLLRIDIGTFFHALVTGQNGLFEKNMLERALVGTVRITVPPYPLVNDNILAKQIYARNHGIVIGEFKNFSWTWLHDVMRGVDNTEYVLAGVDGVVCDVTSVGTHTGYLSDRLAERVCSLSIPNLQIRSDLLTHQIADLMRLKELRYETPRFGSTPTDHSCSRRTEAVRS